MFFLLRIVLGTEVEYQVSYDTELKTGMVEFLVKGNRQGFCNYSYSDPEKIQDPNLQIFSDKFGLPVERVSTWLALIEEDKMHSISTQNY